MLTGADLLAKVNELGVASKSEIIRACGYVSNKKDGQERLNFTAFYEALKVAKGQGQPFSQSGNNLPLGGQKNEPREPGLRFLGKKARKREAIRLDRIERARLHQRQLREEQRSRAEDRLRMSKFSDETAIQDDQSAERVKLIAGQLVDYCCGEHLANVPETSICLRAGYKIEEIGAFRRAFARAAGVEFGPLARMVLELEDESSSAPPEPPAESPAERQTREVRTVLKVRSSRFREAVLKQHGEECVCCSIRIKELLEAAHIVPVAWDGSDHPANGLPLCPTHHSAFDRHLFAYVPGSRELIFREGVSSTELMITKDHLAGDVSDEALALRLRLFREVSGTCAE